MLWKCSTCGMTNQTEECIYCRAAREDGAPSTAMQVLKNTLSSTAMLVTAICLSAAVLLSVALGAMQYGELTPADMQEAIGAVEGAFSWDVPAEVEDFLRMTAEEDSATTDVQIPLVSVLLCVGLWLAFAQGCTKRYRVRRGGLIVLKVAAIFHVVFACLLMVSAGILGACYAILCGTSLPDNSEFAVFQEILTNEWVVRLAAGACVALFALGLLMLFFCIGMLRNVNAMLFTAKTGEFGKRTGLFAPIVLFVMAASMLTDAVGSLLLLDLNGVVSLLSACSCVALGVCLVQYRSVNNRLRMAQPAFAVANVSPLPSVPIEMSPSDLRRSGDLAQQTAPVPQEAMVRPSTEVREPFADAPGLKETASNKNGLCPRCGTPIPDKAFFCLHCGQQLRS